jgi:hypothetical protein
VGNSSSCVVAFVAQDMRFEPRALKSSAPNFANGYNVYHQPHSIL